MGPHLSLLFALILQDAGAQDPRVEQLRAIAAQIERDTAQFLSGGLDERSFSGEAEFINNAYHYPFRRLSFCAALVGFGTSTVATVINHGYPPASLQTCLNDPLVLGSSLLGAAGILWMAYQDFLRVFKREAWEHEPLEYMKLLQDWDRKFNVQFKDLEELLASSDLFLSARLKNWLEAVLLLSLEYNVEARELLNVYRANYSEHPQADFYAAKVNLRYGKHMQHTASQIAKAFRALADHLEKTDRGDALEGTCFRNLERIRFGPVSTYADTYSPEELDRKNR